MSEVYRKHPNQTTAPRLSKRFRQGMAATVFSAGAVVGAGAHAVVSNANEYNKRPTCEFDVDSYDVNSVGSALNKLEGAGVDTSGTEASVIAEDGHLRRRDTDPVDKRGNVVLRPHDRIDFTHIDAVDCAQAGGHIVVAQAVDSQATAPNK